MEGHGPPSMALRCAGVVNFCRPRVCVTGFETCHTTSRFLTHNSQVSESCHTIFFVAAGYSHLLPKKILVLIKNHILSVSLSLCELRVSTML